LSNPSDVLLVLRRSCRLVPGFFIHLLPHSCCLRHKSPMPLLHSGSFQRPSFPGFLYHIVLDISLAIVSPAPCHFCTMGHPPGLRPIPSVVHNFPGSEFSWRRFFCTMPLLHDGIPFCRRQPTSSGIHNLLGSVPVALHFTLQLDVGPCATSSLFPKISLRFLP
jgi:hypothetical protein